MSEYDDIEEIFEEADSGTLDPDRDLTWSSIPPEVYEEDEDLEIDDYE